MGIVQSMVLSTGPTIDGRRTSMSLNEVKNHEATLDMLAALQREGAEFRALLVGEGKMRPQLEQRREALRLAGLLELTGNQRPVTPWL
ncbi:MAG: hypothetical protein ABI650_09525, partial [Dokdonella sp.]